MAEVEAETEAEADAEREIKSGRKEGSEMGRGKSERVGRSPWAMPSPSSLFSNLILDLDE